MAVYTARKGSRFTPTMDQLECSVHENNDTNTGRENGRNSSGNLSSEGDRELGESIESTRSSLLLLIDIGRGLLDELKASEVLTTAELETVTNKPTGADQVNQLVDFVVRSSTEQQNKFIAALTKTDQKHIVDLIYRRGAYEHQFKEQVVETEGAKEDDCRLNSPVLTCVEYKEVERSWCRLIEEIDPDNGLVDELLSAGCINEEQQSDINSASSRTRKNESLLKVIRRRTLGDFHALLKCLAKTNQHRIVALLNPTGKNLTKPSTEEQKMKLIHNRESLLELIEPYYSGLLPAMLSQNCITLRQKDYIEQAGNVTESNKRLLDVLILGSESGFDSFIECLDKTKHRHVSKLLRENGTVANIVVKTADNVGTCQREQSIVEQFMKCSDDEKARIMAMLNQHMDQQQRTSTQNHVELIELRTTASIRLYFMIRTVDGLEYLRMLYTTGKLEGILGQIFASLCEDGAVETKTITWDAVNYSSCARFVYSAAGLPIHAELYNLAIEEPDVGGHRMSANFSIERLPHEVIERLLLKAACQTFKRLRLKTSAADRCSVVSVMSVSSYWRKTLTYRTYLKNLIRTLVARYCYPYRPSLRLVESIPSEESVLYGVAQLHDKLYVIRFGLQPVQVYSAVPPFNHVRELVTPDLVAPVDIVACSGSSSLYLADYAAHCVWRVSVTDTEETALVVKLNDTPWTISMNRQRLLVTAFQGDGLFIYEEDQRILHDRIQLPSGILAQHAIETTSGTFVVSHKAQRDGQSQSGYCGISEISADGKTVLRAYVSQAGGDSLLSTPFHLAADAYGNIMCADRSSRQLILLDSNLRMVRLLIQFDAHPKRINLHERTLAVCFYDSNFMHVYRV